MKVTVTPMRPSSARNRLTNSTNACVRIASSTSDMRWRTDSRSRLTWWCANISARAEHVLERDQHLLQRDVRQQLDDAPLDQLGRGRERVAVDAVQLLDVERGALEALVFLQPAHQLGARVGFLVAARPPAAAAACAT